MERPGTVPAEVVLTLFQQFQKDFATYFVSKSRESAERQIKKRVRSIDGVESQFALTSGSRQEIEVAVDITVWQNFARSDPAFVHYVSAFEEIAR
jgi:hypothetical protein